MLAHRVQGAETKMLAYLLIGGSPSVPKTVFLQEVENGLLSLGQIHAGIIGVSAV
jgi:hypothetical protein